MWGAIKKAINSNLNKSLDVLIQEKTGNINDTGGTTTAGSIFAKLNKLLTDWTTARASKIDNIDTNVNSLIGGRVVKSVQRGVLIAVTINTTVISINSINKDKAMVVLNSYFNHQNNRNAVLTEFTNTSITIQSDLDPTNKVSWQVIEFY